MKILTESRLGLLLAGVFILVFGTSPAAAGLITFNDLTDTLSFTFDPTGDPTPARTVIVNGCPVAPEICNLSLNAPTGYTLRSTTLPATIWIAEKSLALGTPISDTLMSSITSGSGNYRFVSDTDPNNLLTCSALRPCSIVENGNIQLFGTVTWMKAGSPDVVDTIRFQSDVSEPASLLLLGVGLLVVARWQNTSDKRLRT